MALSGQIEIYKVVLNGHNPDFTFRNVAKAEYYQGADANPDDQTLFQSLFQAILDKIANQVCKDDILKKGISIFKSANEQYNNILMCQSDHFTFDGHIDGGYFDIKRVMAKLDKSDQTNIGRDRIIADRYYVYCYLPFTSNIGILMIERRGNLTVSKVVLEVLKSVFKQGNHCSVGIERFIPQSMMEDCRQRAIIDELSFTKQIVTQNPAQGIGQNTGNYDVSIQIKPKSGNTSFTNLATITQTVSSMGFVVNGVTYTLADFVNRGGRIITDDRPNGLTFSVDDNRLKVVKPIPEEVYNADGITIRDIVKPLCDTLLQTVKAEVYPVDHNED